MVSIETLVESFQLQGNQIEFSSERHRYNSSSNSRGYHESAIGYEECSFNNCPSDCPDCICDSDCPGSRSDD